MQKTELDPPLNLGCYFLSSVLSDNFPFMTQLVAYGLTIDYRVLNVLHEIVKEVGLDLRDSNLSNADLFEADLRRADLSEADLTLAKLSNADLTLAKLIGAKLSGAKLSGAKLSGAKLSGADLFEADLRRADLSEAKLSNVNLRQADLTLAKLSNADLFEAKLIGANLSNANLTGANIAEVIFFSDQELQKPVEKISENFKGIEGLTEDQISSLEPEQEIKLREVLKHNVIDIKPSATIKTNLEREILT